MLLNCKQRISEHIRISSTASAHHVYKQNVCCHRTGQHTKFPLVRVLEHTYAKKTITIVKAYPFRLYLEWESVYRETTKISDMYPFLSFKIKKNTMMYAF